MLLRYLKSLIYNSVAELRIYSYLKEVNREVLILDYSKESDLQKDELYFNSFFLNAMGRKVFTKRVLDDLHLVEC